MSSSYATTSVSDLRLYNLSIDILTSAWQTRQYFSGEMLFGRLGEEIDGTGVFIFLFLSDYFLLVARVMVEKTRNKDDIFMF